VPEDDEPQELQGLEVGVLPAVNHLEGQAIQLAREEGRQGPGLRAGIYIAAHRLDRRDLPEPHEHLCTSYIPGVEYPVAAGEQLHDPRPEEPMGIGDDPDAHGTTVSRPTFRFKCAEATVAG
jgi:hypothetical protein